MMSKKNALILGVLAIGGVAVASSIASGDAGGGGAAVEGRAGGILGTASGDSMAPTIYNITSPPPVFPAPATFDLQRFLAPQLQAEPSRGTAGVSAAPKKFYIPGAYVTPVPVTISGKETYVPATTFPAALGIHRALETARSYGGSGGGGSSRVSSGGGGGGSYTSTPGKRYKKKVISKTHTSYRGEAA